MIVTLLANLRILKVVGALSIMRQDAHARMIRSFAGDQDA
jgi:hypothetical protein